MLQDLEDGISVLWVAKEPLLNFHILIQIQLGLAASNSHQIPQCLCHKTQE